MGDRSLLAPQVPRREPLDSGEGKVPGEPLDDGGAPAGRRPGKDPVMGPGNPPR